ncbi:hypothetical protein ACOME3_005416 [Neoechinorhynchus agilis]
MTEDLFLTPSVSKFNTNDPALPHTIKDPLELKRIIVEDIDYPTGKYQAIFALRDLASENNALALQCLCDCIETGDALFRHELAFVLGQLGDPDSADALIRMIDNRKQHYVVRHEAGFSLGSVATDDCIAALRRHLEDDNRVVRESALVGLDMATSEGKKRHIPTH